ncbi:MAG TPA: peptidoglycan editing factor PgeF [Anaerolineae bacterium]|nr:peptidoglycan editing factor PgeF [Anaerolineae bacterium]HQK12322.1 peptidoglycan editing factor PgeF [Anaerolineae bacterium]
MRRVEQNGLVWYTFDGPGFDFPHACFTRRGGVSAAPWAALNLGHTVGDDLAAVEENHRRVCEAFGITRTQIVSPHQVHGCNVVRVGVEDGGCVIPATDALITDAPGVALLLRFADCTPILFYDPAQRALGLAHAGWRGIAAGVVPATVAAMQAAFGTRPADVWAGIGPTIGPQHYSVGVEVVQAIQAALPAGAGVAEQRDGRWYLDLAGAVTAQLRAVGVVQIVNSGLCTAGRVDEWYSHRAENGRTGRFGVLAML